MDRIVKIESFIRKIFKVSHGVVPLYEPRFGDREKEYLLKCLETTFVSSTGEYITQFEGMLSAYTGAPYAVSMVNGTSALHIALLLVGVKRDEEVILQPLTFVATANAIAYCGARPVFVDCHRDSLGLCPEKLEEFLKRHTRQTENGPINTSTGRRIACCVPMHTFGRPLDIDRVVEICRSYRLPVVEDAAESLGSFYKGKHTGSFGHVGIFSFNWNKIITCGGGGALITHDRDLALRAKHLINNAKLPHPWEYFHDEVGYNYSMTNLNASLLCAQMERLENFLKDKRELAQLYHNFFQTLGMKFVKDREFCRSNFWLNTLILEDKGERDFFIRELSGRGIMVRPCWQLINTLPMFANCQGSDLSNASWLMDRIINIPSSVRCGAN